MSPLIDPEKKQKILARMREVEQTTETLREGNAFCALGVICDVSGVAEWVEHPYGGMTYGGRSGCLPTQVEEWLGVDQWMLKVYHNGDPYEVDQLNDGGMPLSEIADLIEEQW